MHATAGGISRSSDVLVRTTTTDDDIRVPLVGAGKRHHDRATGVGVSAVSTGKVRKRTNDIASVNLGSVYESAIAQELKAHCDKLFYSEEIV